MTIREQWKRLRQQKETEIEEAEHVRMPPSSDRDYSMSDDKKRITDEMIELLERNNSGQHPD